MMYARIILSTTPLNSRFCKTRSLSGVFALSLEMDTAWVVSRGLT